MPPLCSWQGAKRQDKAAVSNSVSIESRYWPERLLLDSHTAGGAKKPNRKTNARNYFEHAVEGKTSPVCSWQGAKHSDNAVVCSSVSIVPAAQGKFDGHMR